MYMSSSLHFGKLADYRTAGGGTPTLHGQTAQADNSYGLQGNPTLHALQDAVSRLEKGEHTLLFPSGLSALSGLEVFLRGGDRWAMPDSVYFPVRRFAEYLKDRYGVGYDLYDPSDLSTLTGVITDKTKLIHIETPSSVTFDITDVDKIVGIAHARRILTSADNTWASGVLFQPLDHGVDMSILSLTKYPAGYSDIFMGSVTTRDAALYKQLAHYHKVYGFTVSPYSAMLVSRGLESLKVRMAASGNNAQALISLIRTHRKISKIYYVNTDKAKDFSAGNGLFSVELDRIYSDVELELLFSHLSTFSIGESWGGTRSLVLPFQPDDLAARFVTPKNTIVRFHAGLEDKDLQLADMQAFLGGLEKPT